MAYDLALKRQELKAEVDGQPTKDLFNGLLISDDQAAMAYQGKYPVIFISLKEIKADNFIEARNRIAEQWHSLNKKAIHLRK